MSAGMVWSATLASRLPGSPVAVKDGGIISEQPRSPRMTRTVEGEKKIEEQPLSREMKTYFSELQLLMEYKLLGEQNISGVFLLPSQQTLREWHGVLFVHEGPWKGGVYRFSLIIPDGYPQLRPMVRFRGQITHPYVKHKNGQMNLVRVMPTWNPTKNHLHEVVSAVKQSFLLPEVWQMDNKEEERKQVDTYRRCAMHSTSILSREQEDSNSPENLLRLLDDGDETIGKARSLIHSGELPSDVAKPQGLLDQLSTHVSQFLGKVIGQ